MVNLSFVPKSCTEYSTMGNKIYQNTQLTAITNTRNREGLRASHKNYFVCFGIGKMESVRGCEININDADERNPNLFLSLPSKQHPLPRHSKDLIVVCKISNQIGLVYNDGKFMAFYRFFSASYRHEKYYKGLDG